MDTSEIVVLTDLDDSSDLLSGKTTVITGYVLSSSADIHNAMHQQQHIDSVGGTIALTDQKLADQFIQEQELKVIGTPEASLKARHK